MGGDGGVCYDFTGLAQQRPPRLSEVRTAVCPPRTSKHILQVIWSDGSLEQREITIFVNGR